jgi:hypothetical protein
MRRCQAVTTLISTCLLSTSATVALADIRLDEPSRPSLHRGYRRRSIAGRVIISIGILGSVFGCVPMQQSAQTNSQSEQTCTFDTDCISKNCEFGKCSAFPKPETQKTCAFDAECMSGNCQFGTCSVFPKPETQQTCAFDAQCTSGNCQFGTCSAFPKTGN